MAQRYMSWHGYLSLSKAKYAVTHNKIVTHLNTPKLGWQVKPFHGLENMEEISIFLSRIFQKSTSYVLRFLKLTYYA